jgi:hypothetical protein
MSKYEFEDYIRAQCAAILQFRLAECMRRGCEQPEKCVNTGCDNQRNSAAMRWCEEGRAASFRAKWDDDKARAEKGEGHYSET